MKNEKKGFTLAELLVVVAIIGILVGISIPVFTAQLGKARYAANQANVRAAKAAAVADYLTDENNNYDSHVWYEYDVREGALGEVETEEPSNIGSEDLNDAENISKQDVYEKLCIEINDEANATGDSGDDVEIFVYEITK